MDLKFKSITWVGDVYQKFEAMVLEVEDIMVQETAKYVENQVQTIGGSVKKFYAEVMQDLLPPSSVDSVKGASPDVSLKQSTIIETCKNSRVGVVKELIREKPHRPEELEVIAPMGNDSSHVSSFGKICNENHVTPPSSVDLVKAACSNLSLEQSDVRMYKKSKVPIDEDSIKDSPLPPGVLEVITPVGKGSSQVSLFSEVPNVNNEKACDTLAKKSSPTSFEVMECNSSPKAVVSRENTVREIRLTYSYGASSTGTDTSRTHRTKALTRSSLCREYFQLEAVMPFQENGISDDYNAELAEFNDATGLCMDTNEAVDIAKLQESCVVVDGEDLRCISPRAGKCQSYKKKDAFASKMRLAEEYEQLAIWYEDIDTGFKQQRTESYIPSTLARDLKKIPSDDFCESEWELL